MADDVAYREIMDVDLSQPVAGIQGLSAAVTAALHPLQELRDALKQMAGVNPFAQQVIQIQQLTAQVRPAQAAMWQLATPVTAMVTLADQAIPSTQDVASQLAGPKSGSVSVSIQVSGAVSQMGSDLPGTGQAAVSTGLALGTNGARALSSTDGLALGQSMASQVGNGVRQANSADSQLTTWPSDQWGRIDWTSVWSSASNMGGALAQGLGDVQPWVRDWLGQQWAKVDWISVWSQATGFAAGFGLAIQNVDWSQTGAGLAHGLGTALVAGLEELTSGDRIGGTLADSFSAAVARVDWFEAGKQSGEYALEFALGFLASAFDLGVWVNVILLELRKHPVDIAKLIADVILEPSALGAALRAALGNVPFMGGLLEWMAMGLHGLADEALNVMAEELGKIVGAVGRAIAEQAPELLSSVQGLLKDVFEAGDLGDVVRLLASGVAATFTESLAPAIVGAASAVGEGVMAVAGIVAAAVDPVVLVVGLVIALGAAFVWAYNNVQPLHDAVDTTWAAIRQNPLATLATLLGPVGLAFAAAYTTVGPFHDAVNATWQLIQQNVVPAFLDLWQHVTDLWQLIQQNPLQGLVMFLTGPLGVAFALASSNVQPFQDAVNTVVGYVTDLLQKLKDLADWIGNSPAWKTVQSALSGIAPLMNPGGNVGGNANSPLSPDALAWAQGQTGQWQDATRLAAQNESIDPNVFLRQINQESGFNPADVTNAAGARGIAQLTNDTGLQAAALIGIGPNQMAQFWADPTLQLQAAAALMKKYLQDYNGDWSKALSAYNAGPSGDWSNPETATYRQTILGMASGGTLYEPVSGAGLSTGRQYSFAETGPEEFGGMGRLGRGSSGPVFNVTIHAEGAAEGVAEQIETKLRQLVDDYRASFNNMAVARGALV